MGGWLEGAAGGGSGTAGHASATGRETEGEWQTGQMYALGDCRCCCDGDGGARKNCSVSMGWSEEVRVVEVGLVEGAGAGAGARNVGTTGPLSGRLEELGTGCVEGERSIGAGGGRGEEEEMRIRRDAMEEIRAERSSSTPGILKSNMAGMGEEGGDMSPAPEESRGISTSTSVTAESVPSFMDGKLVKVMRMVSTLKILRLHPVMLTARSRGEVMVPPVRLLLAAYEYGELWSSSREESLLLSPSSLVRVSTTASLGSLDAATGVASSSSSIG
mmetsp:Transcript_44422/g.74042  ORF Transcript_44422/g.74042 Transcript_44422/m.74042 type:complete len:274 (+) Transcript_44422:290-1111(+)